MPITLISIILCFSACEKENNFSDNNNLPNMIIDTDVGIDDAMAILFLLQHPSLTVEGITIAGTGMSNLKPATENALGLIALAGKPEIPVAQGDTIAINSQNTTLRPAEWLLESATMMGLDLPENPNQPLNVGAVNFLIETLSNAEKPMRILVLGPLTNLGTVLQQKPGLTEMIESVIIMGGAVNVPGNLQYGGIEDNTFAEWNIFLDPFAAEIVFNSGVEIILVPLDVTNNAPVTLEFYNRFANNHKTVAANFVFDMISKLMEAYDTFYFWDPLAAGISTDQNIITSEIFPILIIVDEGNENGRTKIDQENGSEIKVCLDANMSAFENLFIDVLNGEYE